MRVNVFESCVCSNTFYEASLLGGEHHLYVFGADEISQIYSCLTKQHPMVFQNHPLIHSKNDLKVFQILGYW